MAKEFPGAHLEGARGTPKECSDYCSKDGNYTEYGQLPSVTGRACKFGDIIAQAEEGDIDVIKTAHPGVYLRYKATLLSSYLAFDQGEGRKWGKGHPP